MYVCIVEIVFDPVRSQQKLKQQQQQQQRFYAFLKTFNEVQFYKSFMRANFG